MTSTPIALKTSTETAYSFQSCSRSGSTPERRKRKPLDRPEEPGKRPGPALEDAVEPEPHRLREQEDEEGEEPDLEPAVGGHGNLEALGTEERVDEVGREQDGDADAEDVIEGHGDRRSSRRATAPHRKPGTCDANGRAIADLHGPARAGVAGRNSPCRLAAAVPPCPTENRALATPDGEGDCNLHEPARAGVAGRKPSSEARRAPSGLHHPSCTLSGCNGPPVP